MPTTTEAYAAEPILAHSMLPESQSGSSTADHESASLSSHAKQYREASTNWNLSLDIEKGLLSSPSNAEDDIFRSGTVIGFSRLRGRSPDGNEDEFVGGLPRHLLTKWLLQSHINTKSSQSALPSNTSQVSASRSQAKAYIIHPPNNTIFSPPRLLSSLQSHPPSLPRTKAISLLDSVQLFPVFDFSAAVDAIHEVSDQLHELWNSIAQQKEELHQQAEQRKEYEQPLQIVIMIAGLDTLTESVIRSSNAVRGTAVLTSALRTLTQLSRIHRDYLSILLVNTSGVGPSQYAIGQKEAQDQAQKEQETQTRNDGVHSIFSVTDAPLFPSLMMRTLDLGIDTHILVSGTDMDMSTGNGMRKATVVEVIKDRVGVGLGRWCVWDG